MRGRNRHGPVSRTARPEPLLRWTAAILGVFLLVFAPTAGQAQEEGISVGAVPAEATLETLDGESVQLEGLTAGRPALVEFWATWCPICQALEPRIRAAHERFGDRAAFLVIAVGVAQTQAQVEQHVARRGVPGRVLWDARGEAVRAFEAPGTGYIVVLDSAGRVAYTGTGTDQDVEAVLERVTAAPER